MPFQPRICFDLISGSRSFSVMLDHLRWISAAMVLVGHARDSIFMPYGSLQERSALIQCFYFITNFADEAVICFFVISGLLVGGKCITGFARGDFSLTNYAIDRLSRLYTVLVPAAALGLAFMWLQARMHVSGECASDDPLHTLAALFFLQNVSADLPCNNHALWSLANEFWYYVLAPSIGFCIATTGLRRAVAVVASIGIVLFLLRFDHWDSHSVLLYFPIWCTGMLAWLKPSFRMRGTAAAVAFAAALLVSRSHVLDRGLFLLRDGMIALSLTVLLIAARRGPLGRGEAKPFLPKTAAALASFSFSVYLVHSPVIDFACAVLPASLGVELPLSPFDPASYAILGALIAVALAVAVGAYVAFERNTSIVRSRMRGFVSSLGNGVGTGHPR